MKLMKYSKKWCFDEFNIQLSYFGLGSGFKSFKTAFQKPASADTFEEAERLMPGFLPEDYDALHGLEACCPRTIDRGNNHTNMLFCQKCFQHSPKMRHGKNIAREETLKELKPFLEQQTMNFST